MGAASEILPPIDSAPLEPFAIPILLDEEGYAWIPHGFRAGLFMWMHVGEGAAIGWAPIPELDKALVTIWGGNPFAPTDEAIAFVISRRGLRGIIDMLTSIERQMDAFHA